MAHKPETKLVREIRTALEESFPGFYFKTHGGPYQRAGLPDLIGVHRGRFIGIEVKIPGEENSLTWLQSKTLDLIRSFEGVAFMTTSVEDTLYQMRKEMKLWPTRNRSPR